MCVQDLSGFAHAVDRFLAATRLEWSRDSGALLLRAEMMPTNDELLLNLTLDLVLGDGYENVGYEDDVSVSDEEEEKLVDEEM